MSGAETVPNFVRRCLAAQQDTFDGWVSFADRPAASRASARMYRSGEVDERTRARLVLPFGRGWAYRMRRGGEP